MKPGRPAGARRRETAVLASLRQWPPAQEAFFATHDRYAEGGPAGKTSAEISER